MTEVATPDPAAVAEVPPVVAPPVAPPTIVPAGTGPWAADLATLFTDDTVRGQVDEFLRAKVQPYTTQLEQQSAQSKDALRLWENLSKDPIDTYVAITEEMFGAEAAQSLLATIQQQLAAQEQQAAPGAPAAPAAVADPRMEAALAWVENQQTQSYYEQEIARIQAAHPDVSPDLLHPFVAAADGNFDQAVELYRSFLQNFNASQGTPPPPGEVAPQVIASDTSAQTPPPVEPKGQTLDEAINDFMREDRERRLAAPPVSG